MKRAAEAELDKPGDVSSDDSSDSDSDENGAAKGNKFGLPNSAKGSKSDGTLVRKAEMYQEFMKHIPIPAARGSQVPFTSWQGLADSLKALYHQPLHYLTNLQLRQWDCLRLGSSGDDACVPLDDLIHPVKAEALVWLMEETHRLTASPLSLAKIWASDEFYHAYIDPVFSRIMSRQKKLAFDALSRHGYRGGPSVLKVPPPKEPEKEPDWSWSTGKDRKTENRHGDNEGSAESYEERERTRAALVRGETLLHAAANKMEREKEKKCFSQKEKRKRDLGQASRGKNYVEEEKRLLRDNGVYSGFD